MNFKLFNFLNFLNFLKKNNLFLRKKIYSFFFLLLIFYPTFSYTSQFQIINPSDDLLLISQDIFVIEGTSPSDTFKIFRNDLEMPFKDGNTHWVDAVELDIGENYFVYEAFDQSFNSLGKDSVLVFNTGAIEILDPVGKNFSYSTDKDTIEIILSINPAGDHLLINDELFPQYEGQSIIQFVSKLQEGSNPFIFKIFEENENLIGYTKIYINKREKHKDSVGSFCFINSIKFFLNNFPKKSLSDVDKKGGYWI